MKEKLKQMRYINSEVKAIETEIMKLEPLNSMDKVKGSTPEFPYTATSFQINGVDIEDYNRRIKRLRNKLVKKKNELLELKEEVQSFIDNIQDSFIRQIIVSRYVNNKSWRDIAEDVGSNSTPDSIRMAAKRFLEKM